MHFPSHITYLFKDHIISTASFTVRPRIFFTLMLTLLLGKLSYKSIDPLILSTS